VVDVGIFTHRAWVSDEIDVFGFCVMYISNFFLSKHAEELLIIILR